jgi:hypothetical protein
VPIYADLKQPVLRYSKPNGKEHQKSDYPADASLMNLFRSKQQIPLHFAPHCTKIQTVYIHRLTALYDQAHRTAGTDP